MHQLMALMLKDLRLLSRDKVGFFFAFVFPILYATFFGSIMSGLRGGGTRKIEVAVVDEDQTAESKAFAQQLSEQKELSVTMANRAQAEEWVRKGERAGYIGLPQGFGAARKQMFGTTMAVQVGVDPSRLAESGLLQGILLTVLYKDIESLVRNPGALTERIDESLAAVRDAKDMDPERRRTLQGFLPAVKAFMTNMPKMGLENGGMPKAQVEVVEVTRERKGPTNSYEISFPQGCIWGIMGCAASFGISLVVERTRGTLVRLRMAPISRAQILAGKGLACLLTTLCVGVTMFLFAALVFGVRPSSYTALAAALLCVSIAFVGIMMLLSVAGKTEQSAGGIGWAILVLMAMIGGGMIPLAFMPGWLQTASDISPVKWAVLAMEGAVWRDFSASEMVKPCAVLVGIGVVCFAIGAKALKWSE